MFWFWISMILMTSSFVTATMWQLEIRRKEQVKKELNECREKLKGRWESEEAVIMREVEHANRLERTKEEAEENRRKYVEAVRVQAEMADEIAAFVQTIRSLAAQNGAGAGTDEICKESKTNEQRGTGPFNARDDYKARFMDEYRQTKIRYERLKKFCNRIEAAMSHPGKVEMPKHDCDLKLLLEQQKNMERYLHALEIRAVVEHIDI